jgi:hypothetical protein
VLYLLIASRADFISIGIRPLGVFLFIDKAFRGLSLHRAMVAEPIVGRE